MKGLGFRRTVLLIPNGISQAHASSRLALHAIKGSSAEGLRRAGISSVRPFPTGEIPDHRYAVSGMTAGGTTRMCPE